MPSSYLTLRPGFRWRRPARHLDVAARCVRVDRVLPPAARVEDRSQLGQGSRRSRRDCRPAGRAALPHRRLPRTTRDDASPAARVPGVSWGSAPPPNSRCRGRTLRVAHPRRRLAHFSCTTTTRRCSTTTARTPTRSPSAFSPIGSRYLISRLPPFFSVRGFHLSFVASICHSWLRSVIRGFHLQVEGCAADAFRLMAEATKSHRIRTLVQELSFA